MCLIIFSPNIKHAKIRRSVLERGFARNSDGAGLAYVGRDNQLVVSKAYMEIGSFLKEYDRVKASVNRGPLLIHFRWGTCGPNNETNTQPLVIHGGRLAMAHNGVFSGLSEIDSEISDSVKLARLIRRNGWEHPFSKAQTDMLKALCDDSSKLVFIDHRGKYTIVNEKLGSWRAGSWYSDKGRVLTAPSSFYKGDDDVLDITERDSGGYGSAYNREYDDYEDEEGRQFALMMRIELERQAIRKHFGCTVTQSGTPLQRPKIPEGIPFAKMTKIQKAAFEAHKEQECKREQTIKEAALARKSLPSHPFAGFKDHSMIRQIDPDMRPISRFD